MGFIRATLRFLFLMLVTIFTVVSILSTSLFVADKLAMGMRKRQQWITWIKWFLGIKVIVKGKAAYPNVLYISNHRSYLDPILQVFYSDALVVAKMEVRSWPIIGYGIAISGAFFVKREDKASRASARKRIARTIQNGNAILIYPEGTTTDLLKTLPFKPRTFHIAAENKVKVVPIAIEYLDPKDAWIGDDTFVRHFFQTFAKKELTCVIHYGPPMWEADGALLRRKAQDWVDAELMVIRKEWGMSLN